MIQDVVAHVRALSRKDRKPWLLVGKGPTLQRHREVDFTRFHVLTLNHACLLVPATIAHFTDVEAYIACRHALYYQPCSVCLPWYPHVQFRSGERSLAHHCEFEDTFHGCIDERLLSYNSTLSHRPTNPALATIRVRYFSAVAACNILLAADVREIFSLGVDGGTEYCPGFNPKDRLANSQPSFDVQFGEISASCQRHRAQWLPLFRLDDKAGKTGEM